MAAAVNVEPIAGALGAVVEGLDLRAPLPDEHLAALRSALAEHLVVLLPEQRIGLDELERFTDELGGRDVTPYIRPVDGRPAVIRVIKEPEDELNFANAWHSDLSYLAAPPSYTVLHAWDVPRYGGDTVFANQYAAFESLSSGLQDTLAGLDAVHSAGMAYGTGGYLEAVAGKSSMSVEPSAEAHRSQEHPIVIEHPVTGRPALYVNPVYTTRIAGWSATESAALLGHLHRQAVHENLTCRVRWSTHLVTIWDNRCVLHNALNDYRGVRRELYRTSVMGAAPERWRRG